ncbi:hypothetical protein DL98DRAFT_595486 [Cadophora sp. DSE1049]|nr:hypothetical protein DL98DRAFT_595486 [Cadophora sp. DSE1049]
MASSNTYSTTAVDGSADEFGPSPSVHSPKTPAQVAANKALERQRMNSFMADSSLPTLVTRHRGGTDDTISDRRDAAAANIACFDKAFDRYTSENKHHEGK